MQPVIKVTDDYTSHTINFPIDNRPSINRWLGQYSFKTQTILEKTELTTLARTDFNDGNTSYLMYMNDIARNKYTKDLFILKSFKLILKVCKSGKMQLTCNGRLVLNYQQLMIYIQVIKGIADSQELFKELQVLNSPETYYLSRNLKLKELPCDVDFLCKCYYSLNKNHKSRINYHLKRGNTHKAVDAFLGHSFPKSLRKVLLSNVRYFKLAIDCKRALQQDVPVSTIVRLVTHDCSFLLILASKYPQLRIPVLNANNNQLACDCMNMLLAINDYEYFELASEVVQEITTTNLRELHDQLIQIYNRKQLGLYSDTVLKYHQSEYDVYQSNTYTVAPVVNSFECQAIGKALSICVGSYISGHDRKQFEILSVVNTQGKYIACLQISNNQLIQAKLRFNEVLHKNPVVLEVVKGYCEQFDIDIVTSDVNPNLPSMMPF